MTRKLIPAQRHKRILEHLTRQHVVQNTSLAEMLRVSEATVRRDLEELDARGLLERTHGGAIFNQRLAQEPEYTSSAQSHPQEKRWIGICAAGLVEDGDIIFVNSGTTATQLVSHLRDVRDLTLVTNNVRATQEAREAGLDIELILLGGTFRYRSDSVAGVDALGMLNRIYASKAFIGVDGISLRHGCTTPTAPEADIARVMIERTHGPVIVLADHSKWGVVSNYQVASIDQIQAVVTDDGFADSAREALETNGIKVHLARTPRADNAPLRLARSGP